MIDANDLEKMAKERPNDLILKGSGVLKLTGAIRAYEREIEALRAESARLDLVLSRGAFLVESKTDAGGVAYQLTTQDEDEGYHAISGADRFFATPRAAIDAALAANLMPEAGG